MVILIDGGKTFDKTQIPFVLKFSKIDIHGKYLNTVRALCDKCIIKSYLVVKNWKLWLFSQKQDKNDHSPTII